MKLPITKAQQAALDWLAERGGRQGTTDAPFRAGTWKVLVDRGFVYIDDAGHACTTPIDPLLELTESDIEESALNTIANAERFAPCQTM
jgi:hypothetical protein